MLERQTRTAMVTGASRGIGRAIAEALGGEGFSVAINYHRNAAAAEAVAAEVTKRGGRAMTLQCDVGNVAEHARLVDAVVERFGGVHLLVNNAGVAPRVRRDILEVADAEEFDYVLNTNLKGPYLLSIRVANRMIEQLRQGGDAADHGIINIGSISAYSASVNRGEYCIAKAGLAMVTQLLATRLAEHAINVYEIRPGIIETDMTGAVKAKYDKLIFQENLLPLRRWGQPGDVAKAVIAVANGLLPYSTGQVIDVDGGFHLRRL